VYGNFAALKQSSFTRMLAYSGIAQVGYALIGVTAGAGWSTMLLVAVYAPAALGCFLVAQALADERPEWDGSIEGMTGLARTRPGLAIALAVFMLSLTGVPIFAGFWGKLGVFVAAAGSGWLWLAILGAIGSVVSFGYYGGVLRSVFLGEGEDRAPAPGTRDPAAAAAVVLAALVVAAGLVPLFIGSGSLLRILGG
jgi:NADH-quinone oxidoreductase subunit N